MVNNDFCRNPKDACVSFYHMDKLMEHHGMRQDYEFDEYVNDIFLKDKTLYGSYWTHLNVTRYFNLGEMTVSKT